MAREFGIVKRDITVLLIGGLPQPERLSHELAVAIAGPADNVVIT